MATKRAKPVDGRSSSCEPTNPLDLKARWTDLLPPERAKRTKEINMLNRRILPAVVFIGGAILLVLGVRETESFGSQFKEFFTGSISDRAVWMILGGVACIVFAGVMVRASTRESRL
jgi:hypothetical protein